MSSTAAITIQETPTAPIQGWFVRGSSPLPARPPTDQAAFTTREQPDHLVARTGISLAGPTVRPPTDQRAITTREQPFHPGPKWDRGVAPKPSRPPTDQATIGRQEQPPFYKPSWAVGPVANARVPVTDRAYQPDSRPAPVGYAFARPGLQGPNVRLPVSDTVLQVREQPFHPGPRALTGPYGYNSRPAIVDVVIIRQALPDHLQPLLRASLPGLSIRPLNDRVVIGQQLPDHPRPEYTSGVQGPDIRPLNDRVVQTREQPFHPGPLAFGPPPLITPATQVSARVFVVQTLPDHPRPGYTSGVQGPNTKVANDRVVLVQTLPDHPRPGYTSGVQGPNVALRITDRVWIAQARPDSVLPVISAGPIPILIPDRAVGDRALLVQELVSVGKSTTDNGPVLVGLPIPLGAAIAAREEGREPPPLISLASVQGLAVAVPQGLLLVSPEQPAQPLPPALFGAVSGDRLRPPTYRIILAQEYPGEPVLSLSPALAGPNVIPPLLGLWSFPQQYPSNHPPPFAAAGPYNIILLRARLIFDWMGSADIVDDELEPS